MCGTRLPGDSEKRRVNASSQPSNAALLASARHHLHAQADAQDRLSLHERLLAQAGNEARFGELSHAVAEVPNPWQDQFVRRCDVCRRAAHAGFGADLAQHVQHRRHVADAVVDDHDHATSSAPAFKACSR
jgi:hypothetical protein